MNGIFFVDKCLPFGNSISCALFQKVSDAVTYIVRFKTKLWLINYLEDFLFVSSLKWACNQQLEAFLVVSKQINMPISEKKTFYATTCLTFLGFLIDGERHMILIPSKRLQKSITSSMSFLRLVKEKQQSLNFSKSVVSSTFYVDVYDQVMHLHDIFIPQSTHD